MVDPELGLAIAFNGCIYNYPELREELEATRATASSRTATPKSSSRPIMPGGRTASSASTACSPSPSTSATAAASCSRATASASSRSTSPRRPGGCASPRRCRRCWPAGDVDTSIDRVALAPLHELPRRRAGAAHDPRTASASCRRRRCGSSSRTAASHDTRYWELDFERGAEDVARCPSRTGATWCSRRCARRSSGAWSPTCRSACCCRAASIPA